MLRKVPLHLVSQPRMPPKENKSMFNRFVKALLGAHLLYIQYHKKNYPVSSHGKYMYIVIKFPYYGKM